MNVSTEKQYSRFERILALIGITVAIFVFTLIYKLNPANSGLFPPCPFYALTGFNCPGCGATRGMHALLNGEFLVALDYNLLLVVFVPLVIYALIMLLAIALRGRNVSRPNIPTSIIWMLLTIALVFGVLRNLPFYPFNTLAP